VSNIVTTAGGHVEVTRRQVVTTQIIELCFNASAGNAVYTYSRDWIMIVVDNVLGSPRLHAAPSPFG